jgi:hypothetical protein
MSSKRASSNCPACGSPVEGKFCPECGTPVGGAPCPRCESPLAAGAKFCAECGAAAGAQRADSRVGWFTGPRAVGGLAALALVVVVTAQLGSQMGTTGAPSAVQAGPAASTDISNLSPRDAASRLYDRVMRLHEERKTDSVAFFAPMALTAYASIPDMDADARYDMARIAMVAGQMPVARAQADTILRADSTHLLGLLLGADVARAAGDVARAKRMETLFVASADRERARRLPEYEAHGREIESVLARLRATTK